MGLGIERQGAVSGRKKSLLKKTAYDRITPT
jgi:hypothetical protein